MGLDCYFQSQQALRFPGNTLLGELNAFRGRKYAPFVLHITGYSLYQEILDATAIQRMAHALRAFLVRYQGAARVAPEELVWQSSEGRYCDITFYDLQQLVIVFEFAGEHRLFLFNHS